VKTKQSIICGLFAILFAISGTGMVFAQETQEEPAQSEPAKDEANFFQKIGQFFLDLDAKAHRVDLAQNEHGEKRFAAGAGVELNLNARDTVAMGFPFSFDYNLPTAAAPFAVGANVIVSSGFAGATVLETAASFRWYFLGSKHVGFFTQADLGAYLIFEDEKTHPLFLGGLRGGYRLPFGSMFYVDPYVRLGYPFVFGFGALAGIRFDYGGLANEQ